MPRPSDLVRPGHVFPLRAAPGGVLERRGHTEGSVDLSRMAGLNPAAVLCELMNPDGTMMRGDDIERFAELHGMPISDHRRDGRLAQAARLIQAACTLGRRTCWYTRQAASPYASGIAELGVHLGEIDPQLVRIWPDRAEPYDVWLVMHDDLSRSARVRAAADAIIASVGNAKPAAGNDKMPR